MPTVPKDDSRVPMTPNQTVGEDFRTMAYGLMRRSQEVQDFTGWKGYLDNALPVDRPPQGELAGTQMAKDAGEDALKTGKSEAMDIMATRPMQFSGSSDDVWKSIFQQESSSGKDLRTSSTGAMGPGQIMPNTFKQWAKPGEDIRNYDDNVAVSKRIVESYHKQFGGDPARIATAYFSGPGNVAPAGSSTPWKVNKSDGRTSTSEYVQQVIGRMGGSVGQSGVPQARSRGDDWSKINRYSGAGGSEPPRFKPNTSWLDEIVNQQRRKRKA
jgi:Transglycosylase SLT domain